MLNIHEEVEKHVEQESTHELLGRHCHTFLFPPISAEDNLHRLINEELCRSLGPFQMETDVLTNILEGEAYCEKAKRCLKDSF